MEKSYILISGENLSKLLTLVGITEISEVNSTGMGEVRELLEDSVKSTTYEDIHIVSEELKSQSQYWKTQGKDDLEGKFLESAQLLQKAAHNLLV